MTEGVTFPQPRVWGEVPVSLRFLEEKKANKNKIKIPLMESPLICVWVEDGWHYPDFRGPERQREARHPKNSLIKAVSDILSISALLKKAVVNLLSL